MLAAGKITSQQANLLTGLANRGHLLASMEKGLESALKTGLDKNTLDAFEMTVDYTKFRDLNDVTGRSAKRTFHGLWSIVSLMDVEKGTNKPSARLLEFQNSLDAVNRSGAVSDPGVKVIVNQLAGTIFKLADDIGNSTKDFMRDKIASSTNVITTVASEQTHNASAQICTSGSGSDSGVHCQ